MSEAVNLAKAAREQLAAALNALQSSDTVPVGLGEVAEPIALAMGVLHRVERSNGENLEGRDVALANVRKALEKVQLVTDPHPAVDVVMDAVATSLSKVHALVRFTPAPVARPTPPPAQPAPAAFPPAPKPVEAAPAPAPVVQPVPVVAVQPAPAPVVQPVPVMAVQPAPAPVAQHVPAPAAQHVPAPAAQHVPAPVAQHVPAPQPVAQPVAQPAPAYAPAPQPVAPAPVAAAPAPMVQTQPSAQDRQARVSEPSRPAVPAPSPSRPASAIDVELGIHSASNFYKGLSGNDVIDHGGIFVATYKVPKIGASVQLRVLLPGDYEFHAAAVVQWTRESGGGADPGFGARFTQITPEGRQLVYRYARNREPMFYDDL